MWDTYCSGKDHDWGDEWVGFPAELHEEAALHRAGPDPGRRRWHHAQVHPFRPLEPYGRLTKNLSGRRENLSLMI